MRRPSGCSCRQDWHTLVIQTAGCPIHDMESPDAVTVDPWQRPIGRARQFPDDADVYICRPPPGAIPGGADVPCFSCGTTLYAAPSTVAAMERGAVASCFACVPPEAVPEPPKEP